MGGRNRLLNFRHTRSSTLEITSPGAGSLLEQLARGWDFAPVEEEQSGVSLDKVPRGVGTTWAADGLLTQKQTQQALDTALRQLRQKSNQTFNDFGLWVLWVGVGMLDWCEEGAHESSSAPLVLVPVQLVRDRTGRIRLQEAEEQDALHNPALAVKLAQLGVDWTAVADTDCRDAAAVLARARAAAAGQTGWVVRDSVVLAMFAAHKEAMYQDLKENEAAILASPLIRAIGLGPDAGLPDDVIGFEPPAIERIDEVQVPERTPLVLDADASQRQCIAAAMENRSFVMSGPPGTGKSQTITNMIAALMHSGRSVLFVSEKAAALDVVRNRLTDVGLGDFVLALHSSDTSKKAVAQELDRALTTEVRASGAAQHELDEARRLREELSAYAAAMNEVRQPLGRTLHDVIGRLALLGRREVPQLTLTSGAAAVTDTLSAAALHEVLTAARSVARSWRPVAEGDSFAWWGLRDPEATGAGSATTALADAADALQSLRAAAERRPLAADTPLPRTARDVRRIADDLRAGLPVRTSGPTNAPFEDHSPVIAQLAEGYGLGKPRDIVSMLALFELVDLEKAENRPPVHWFDVATMRQAQAAAEQLREALGQEAAARGAAQDVFGPQVLNYEALADLVRRFAEDHHGLTADPVAHSVTRRG
ncbi:DUF4011 domain-containing protein [Streptomyces erythrochromogenes]|uniref:DUF4011 domain-containing protein n=1 Tax=Streptomyces erythrochromogenes TaxID=285574 RepID=UPI003446BAB1